MRRSSCTTLGVERVSRHRLSSSGSLISLSETEDLNPAPGAVLQALIGHMHLVYLPLCLSICPLASARRCDPRHGDAHRLLLFPFLPPALAYRAMTDSCAVSMQPFVVPVAWKLA